MEILRIKNNRIIDRVLGQIHEEETLDDLNVNDVFERCLAVHEVPEDQRPSCFASTRKRSRLSMKTMCRRNREAVDENTAGTFMNLNSLVGEWQST